MIINTTALTAAQEQIGRLTFEIGCMKTELDSERKRKDEKLRLYSDWLEAMIKSESELPMGPDCTHIYKSCQEYFNELVMK